MGSMPSVSSNSTLNREPMTAAALSVRLAFGSSRSMRAAMVACKVAGTLASLTSAVDTYAPVCPAVRRARLVRARSPRRRGRIPGGPLGDRVAQRAIRRVRAEQLRDQCRGF